MAPNGLNAHARSQAIGHAQPTKTSIKQGHQSIITIKKLLIFKCNYMRLVDPTEKQYNAMTWESCVFYGFDNVLQTEARRGDENVDSS